MAITAVEYALFSELKQSRQLPQNPSFLEIGEANWYGDVPLERLCDDICQLPDAPEQQIKLLEELLVTVRSESHTMLWDVAKIFYRLFLDYRKIVAVDFGGTEQALRLDLNQPISLGQEFDIVYNGGTAEHVFNVWQFFKTVHDHTAPGGIMIHGAPFTGWLDHGLFNFNATFFWDLAAANGYVVEHFRYTEVSPLKMIRITRREQLIEMAADGKIGSSSHIYVVFRKPEANLAFVTPQQGYYAGALSDQAEKAWAALR